DAGVDGGADRISEGFGIRDGDHEAVRLRGDRGLDDLAHLHHVEGAGRLVLDRHAHVVTGGGDAVGGHRPERVGRLAVGDDYEAVVTLGHGTAVVFVPSGVGGGRSGGVGGPVVGGCGGGFGRPVASGRSRFVHRSAGSGDQRQHCQQHQ